MRPLGNKIQLDSHPVLEDQEEILGDAHGVVIAYGSTARSAKRAVITAREEGLRAGLLRLITVWPFPEKKVKKLSEQAVAFVVPEVNLGQMSREVERFTSLPVVGVNHAGGVMMAPDPILDAIREAVA